MPKHTVVMFLDKNARIIRTDDIRPYKGIPGILIDPDLSGVQGHPPHYWKRVKDKVVPHSNEEKVIRDNLWKDLKWDHEAIEIFFFQAKSELKRRQLVYAGIAALMVLLPVVLFYNLVR